jgi:hypothetical protein
MIKKTMSNILSSRNRYLSEYSKVLSKMSTLKQKKSKTGKEKFGKYESFTGKKTQKGNRNSISVGAHMLDFTRKDLISAIINMFKENEIMLKELKADIMAMSNQIPNKR